MKQITPQEREEMIRRYAYCWWEFMEKNHCHSTPEGNWKRAERMVENELSMESITKEEDR